MAWGDAGHELDAGAGRRNATALIAFVATFLAAGPVSQLSDAGAWFALVGVVSASILTGFVIGRSWVLLLALVPPALYVIGLQGDGDTAVSVLLPWEATIFAALLGIGILARWGKDQLPNRRRSPTR